MHKGKFGTAINCMDGRVQLPVINWLKEKYALDFVDMITEPGPDKILSSGKTEQIESIKSRVIISVNAHGSDKVIIVSHHDCAGNPVSKEEHLIQLKECLKLIHSWKLPLSKVMGIWISDKWSVDEVFE